MVEATINLSDSEVLDKEEIVYDDEREIPEGDGRVFVGREFGGESYRVLLVDEGAAAEDGEEEDT